MSSVEGYFPEGLSVMMESDPSFSKSLGILTLMISLSRTVFLSYFFSTKNHLWAANPGHNAIEYKDIPLFMAER